MMLIKEISLKRKSENVDSWWLVWIMTVDDWYELYRMILRNDAIIQSNIKWAIHNVHHIQ